MAGFVAPALFFNIGPMEVVEEDGDAPLDEEVGDQLHEDGSQDQLQVLLQPAKLFLYRGFHSERSLTPGGLSIELKIRIVFSHPSDSSLCREHISPEEDSPCTQFLCNSSFGTQFSLNSSDLVFPFTWF